MRHAGSTWMGTLEVYHRDRLRRDASRSGEELSRANADDVHAIEVRLAVGFAVEPVARPPAVRSRGSGTPRRDEI